MTLSSTNRVTPRELLWCVLLLFLGLILWHGPLVFGSQVVAGGDLTNYFIPLRMGQLSRGWFAGWQPETFCGRPIIDNIQTGILYPPNWLHLTGISVERVFTLLCLAHLMFGGIGMYLFGRERIAHVASMLAAFVWTFSAYQELRLTNGVVVFTYAFPWIPWMLWAAERQSLEFGPGLRWVGLLALFGGLQISAGAAQIVQLTWVGLGFWTLGRLLFRREGENMAAIIGGFLLAGLLSLVMCTPILAAAFRIQGEAFARGADDPWLFLSDGSVPLRLLWTWVFPEFFAPGNSERFYWGYFVGYAESNAYIGILPILLVCLAVVTASYRQMLRELKGRWVSRETRWAMTLGFLAVFGFLVAQGDQGFLFRPLTEYVPTFNFFRVPARWILWIVIPACIAAGIGLQVLLDGMSDEEKSRGVLGRWLAVGTVMLVFAAIVRMGLNPLLRYLGLDAYIGASFPENFDELMEGFRDFSRRAVQWGMVMAAVSTALGALLVLRRLNPRAVLAMLFGVMMLDLVLFWIPFTGAIPGDTPSYEIESEDPHHRALASQFRDYFYPETELIADLKGDPEVRRIHYMDSLAVYFFDQNQREMLRERPMAFGLEITRGYEQLHLSGYVDDYYQSFINYPRGKPDAFLKVYRVNDRRFMDAYNVTHVLSYRVPALESALPDLDRIGLVYTKPIGGFGVHLWRNPGARGWAWLSPGPRFLDAEPDDSLGTVELEQREATVWKGSLETTGAAWLHLSSPDYSGWELTAWGQDGIRIEARDSRSVYIPAAGNWAFERRFSSPIKNPAYIAITLAAVAMALLMVGMARPRRSQKENSPE